MILAMDFETGWAVPGSEVAHKHDTQVSATEGCHPFTPATTSSHITLSAGTVILNAVL